jgi:hypothetical protein
VLFASLLEAFASNANKDFSYSDVETHRLLSLFFVKGSSATAVNTTEPCSSLLSTACLYRARSLNRKHKGWEDIYLGTCFVFCYQSQLC